MKTQICFRALLLMMIAFLSPNYASAACSHMPKSFSQKDSCPVYHFEGANPTDSSGKPYTDTCLRYIWTFGDGTTDSGQIINHHYTKNGSFSVCLKVRDLCHGCDTTICKIVEVHCLPGCNLPSGFFRDSSFSSGRTTFVSNLSIDTNGKFYDDKCLQYSWNFGNGDSSASRVGFCIYNRSGSYNVCLKITDTCNNCDTTYCREYYIEKYNCYFPEGFLQSNDCNMYTFSGKDPIDSNGNTYLDSCQNYLWDFGDGTKDDGKSIKHTYKSKGTYTVCLRLYDRCLGCDTTFCKTIDVNCVDSFGTSSIDIATQAERTVRVYPTPANTSFTIHAKGNAVYTIFNAFGITVLSGNITDHKIIDAAGMPAGMYIIQVQNDEKVEVLKLLISH